MKIFVMMCLMLTVSNSHAGKLDNAKSYIKDLLGFESPSISNTSTEKKAEEKSELKPDKTSKKKKIAQDFNVLEGDKKLECDTKGEYPLCERVNPENGKLEYFRFLPSYKVDKDAKRIKVDRKDGGISPIWLTLVDSSTTIPSAGAFDGTYFDQASNSYKEGSKPVEKIEVPEAPIKDGSVVSTPDPKLEEKEKTAFSANTLPPEAEVADVKPQTPSSPAVKEMQKAQVDTEPKVLALPLVKLEQEQSIAQVERNEAAQKPVVNEANLVVVNNTSKNLHVTVKVFGNRGSRDVDMGMLGAGERMTLLCNRDFIFLIFEGSWGFRKELTPSCGKDPQKTYGVLVDPNGPRPAS